MECSRQKPYKQGELELARQEAISGEGSALSFSSDPFLAGFSIWPKSDVVLTGVAMSGVLFGIQMSALPSHRHAQTYLGGFVGNQPIFRSVYNGEENTAATLFFIFFIFLFFYFFSRAEY